MRLCSTSAPPAAVRVRRMPESSVSRLRPEPRTVSLRTVTPGTVTVMTLPSPLPATVAASCPSSVTARPMVTGPRWTPG